MAGARRIGVMGGTFDPIHNGHLAAAEAVREAYELEQVIFVPAGIPPHKDSSELSPARDRYLMALLATLTNPFFEISRIELDAGGVNYTVDTARRLQEELDGAALYFIVGADMLLDLPNWREPERLLELCSVVGVTRPGVSHREADERVTELLEVYGERIQFLEAPTLDISSSQIRARVAAGRSIRYLVPELVEDYIDRNGLYRKSEAP